MKKSQLLKTDLTDEQLTEFNEQSEIAVDCEMMGLNPFRDRLCVIQMAYHKGPCLLLQINESQPYPNLRTIFENPEIHKIFHFARMDCLFIKQRLGIKVKNIVCTKIASKIARTYTDKHGLKELVRVIVGENLDKGQQTSDWGRSELSSEQLNYAALDVKYLFAIKQELFSILERENRSHLYQEAINFLPTLIELDQLGYGNIFDH